MRHAAGLGQCGGCGARVQTPPRVGRGARRQGCWFPEGTLSLREGWMGQGQALMGGSRAPHLGVTLMRAPAADTCFSLPGLGSPLPSGGPRPSKGSVAV